MVGLHHFVESRLWKCGIKKATRLDVSSVVAYLGGRGGTRTPDLTDVNRAL